MQHYENIENDVQVILSPIELKAHCKEIEDFLINHSEKHSFLQSPYTLAAECDRTPELVPFVIIIRVQNKITAVALGHITTRRFNLSLSIIPLPAPQLKILNLPGSGLAFRKNSAQQQSIECFFNILKIHKQQIDIISLNEIQLTSHLWQYVHQHYTPHRKYFLLTIASAKKEIISWHELQESYEHWYRSLRAKTRKRIAWEQNRFLKRAPLPVQIKRVEKKEDVADFMQHVKIIRENSWQGKTIAAGDHDINEEIIFFEKLASYGWLRSYLLICGDEAAAYELAIQYNDECIFLERGYNQNLYKLAPGTFLTYHIVQDCYDYMSPRAINFGFGENEFKKRLRTKTQNACYAYLTMPGRWRALVLFQKGLNFIENKISTFLKRINLDRSVRKFLKQKK